jgi:hypothetical protein
MIYFQGYVVFFLCVANKRAQRAHKSAKKRVLDTLFIGLKHIKRIHIRHIYAFHAG